VTPLSKHKIGKRNVSLHFDLSQFYYSVPVAGIDICVAIQAVMDCRGEKSAAESMGVESVGQTHLEALRESEYWWKQSNKTNRQK
jgi:hypothetical protein